MIFECVSKQQYESDSRHANYIEIEAENKNQAKYKYVKLDGDTDYKDVLCRTKKGYPQW
jgi:hypothetical protein